MKASLIQKKKETDFKLKQHIHSLTGCPQGSIMGNDYKVDDIKQCTFTARLKQFYKQDAAWQPPSHSQAGHYSNLDQTATYAALK